MTHATSEARDAGLASLLFTLALLLDPKKKDSIGSLTAGCLTRANAGLLGHFPAPEPHEAVAYHFGATGYQNVTAVAVHPSGGFAASLLRPDGTSTIVSGLSLNPARGSGIARDVYETAGFVSGLHFPAGSTTPAWQVREDPKDTTFTLRWGSGVPIPNCIGTQGSAPTVLCEEDKHGNESVVAVHREGDGLAVACHNRGKDGTYWTDVITRFEGEHASIIPSAEGIIFRVTLHSGRTLRFVWGDQIVEATNCAVTDGDRGRFHARIVSGRLEVLNDFTKGTLLRNPKPSQLSSCVCIRNSAGYAETIENAFILDGRLYRVDGARIMSEDGTHLLTLPVAVIPRSVTRVPGGHIVMIPKTQEPYTNDMVIGFAPDPDDGRPFRSWDLPDGFNHGNLIMLDLAVTEDVAVLSSGDYLAGRLLATHPNEWLYPGTLRLVHAPHVKSPVLVREGEHTVAYTLRKNDASVRVLRYPLT